MKRRLHYIECIFLIILSFFATTVFISILIEETLYYYEKDFDYGPYNNNLGSPKSKTRLPVSGHPVKFPNHNQEDPELVKDLASKIIPPNPRTKEYNVNVPVRGELGKLKHIRKLNNYKGDRFFLECGAGDGETLSNTLYLEKGLFWGGLLVEADPAHFKQLFRVNRKAWVAPVCMSLNTSAYIAPFRSSPLFKGKILTNESLDVNVVNVTCYPFYTFILALNIKRIDYLSLSVSGHEMEILKTIPFQKVDVGYISVNYYNATGGYNGVKSFLLSHNYDVMSESSRDELIFVNAKENYWPGIIL